MLYSLVCIIPFICLIMAPSNGDAPHIGNFGAAGERKVRLQTKLQTLSTAAKTLADLPFPDPANPSPLPQMTNAVKLKMTPPCKTNDSKLNSWSESSSENSLFTRVIHRTSIVDHSRAIWVQRDPIWR